MRFTLLAILLAFHAATLQAAQQADRILLNGKIITLDADESVAQAVAIRGGRILAVGSDAEIFRHQGDQTQVTKLDGRTVVPGLIESHCHPLGVARQSLVSKYSELTSIDEIQNWLRRRAELVKPGEWIRVPRCDITRLAERRHPTPAELDQGCATHPVVFNAARKWVLNSRAFSQLEITAEKPTIKGGRVLLDPQGQPRMIAGGDARLRSFLKTPKLADELILDRMVEVLHRYNQVGITSIFDRATDLAGYQRYQRLRKERRLSVRTTVTFRRQMNKAEDVARMISDLGLKPREGDDWVRAGPLKITVDGGIHWGNTHLREAYGPRRIKFYVHDDPEYRGDLRYTVEQMRDVFAAAHRAGWQMCCHVTGDAGVDRVLDALTAAKSISPVQKQRFTLVHAYFPIEDSILRAAKLGVCVDTQCYLYYKDSAAIAQFYNNDWASRFIGIGAWQRGGVPVAINSDHMIGLDPDHAMNAYNPFLQMYIAVSRKNDQGKIYGAHQKVSRLTALRSMTTAPAYLAFNEKTLGTLERGKLADLVVLDRDYLSCPEEEIRKIRPVMTMVDGEIVFEMKQATENTPAIRGPD